MQMLEEIVTEVPLVIIVQLVVDVEQTETTNTQADFQELVLEVI